MKTAQSFSEWHEAQFEMTKEEVESLRNAAEAFLQNPLVRRLFAQMEANAVQYLVDADPLNREDVASRLVMAKAARALPQVLRNLVDDKKADKALNR